MATIWVDSAATGLADGTSYTDAYTTLGAAAAVDVAGDVIHVVSTHSESLGGAVYDFADADIYTVNSSGVFTEPVAMNITATGGDITLDGKMRIHGVWMSAADDFIPSGEIWYYGGKIVSDATLTGDFMITFPGTNDFLHCYNTLIDLTGQRFNTIGVYGSAKFIGCTVVGTATSLINHSGLKRQCRTLFEDCDFSGHSATTVITGTIGNQHLYEFNRCQWPTGVAITGTAVSAKGSKVSCHGCAFGDVTQAIYLEDPYGVVTDELGIYRTAGAVNGDAANTSLELLTTALGGFGEPLITGLASQYIDTADYTTNITFTVHFAVDGSAVALNDDEFWIEVEYTDGADNALGVIADNRSTPLATGTAPTTETTLWTGLGGTNKQMSVSKTITIGTTAGTIASGLVRVKAYLGKASQTVFVCPQVEMS